jgi:maltose/moltooligosaccharide transporter
MQQPKLSFWQIWNLSVGFFGVQIGFALQNANMSRVLSDLGANLYSLSYMWLLAPLMGLIIQPWVGGASDRTWTRLGRRGPYILGGTLIATVAMFLMPQAPIFVSFIAPMIFGLVVIAIMDASFNVAFQPFRALVSDMVPEEQRNQGYSIQSLLINLGAIIGSILPFVLTNVLALNNKAGLGEVAETVAWSFYLGAAIMIGSVLWTVIKTKEYSPKEYVEYKGIDPAQNNAEQHFPVSEKLRRTFALIINMPKTMKQLAIVQFFSWLSMFLMWVYILAAITQNSWGIGVEWFNPTYIKEVGAVPDAILQAKGTAGDWLGILYAMMYFSAAVFAFFMAKIANKIGRKLTFSLGLLAGALGFMSMGLFTNPDIVQLNLFIAQVEIPSGAVELLVPMMGVGIAWSVIIAMPYSILAGTLPADKTGIYMGIFNITVVLPQIVCGFLAGMIVQSIFDDHAINMMWLAGASLFIASISVAFVVDTAAKKAKPTTIKSEQSPA